MESNITRVLTEENFDNEVSNNECLIVVDFWAPWCGPCRMLSPTIDQMAEELKDKKVVVAKVNIDEEESIATKFNIVSIPTILVFKHGKQVEKIVGVRTKQELIKMLESHMLV